MKERKPYRYQYSGNTLVMNGWCGLNEDEQEWLHQLEHFVHSMTEKMMVRMVQAKTPDDRLWVSKEYHRSIDDAVGQIHRLKARVNMKYGHTEYDS